MLKDGGSHASSVRRRLLVAGAALPVVVWPGGLHAQAPDRIRRIGVLSNTASSFRFPAFRQGLRDLGWIEGKNIVIEAGHAERKVERFPELAAELVRLKVDIIFARSSNAAARAAQQATTNTPIVVTYFGDPVAAGLVESLARPGGNITGLSHNSVELVGKRLELLKEMVPKLTRVAVLWSAPINAKRNWERLQFSAKQLGVQLHSMDVTNVNEIDKAFEDAAKARVGALLITGTPLIDANLKQIAGLAAKYHLPSIHNFSDFADAGGLAAYGASRNALDRRATTFMDKILKGAKPHDLPMEQPTEFVLMINLKTAKALGITMPVSVLAQADRII